MDAPEGLVLKSPLFLLTTTQKCSLCGKENPVVALATRTLESEDPEEFEGLESEGFVLSNIEALPETILAEVVARQPCYQMRYSQTMGFEYFMSTCECGGHYGDHYVLNQILDQAFREPATLTIERLPVTLPAVIPCGYRMSDSIAYLLDKQ